jgi:predicted TIM-barrel enzyme
MSGLAKPDRDLLEQWLRDTHVTFDHCGECEGLHLSALQSIDGVIDSRIFLEHWGILLTTELEIRPMAMLAVCADLGRLNMNYPTLKIFLDVVDDATPQLVMAGTLPAGAGLSEPQCANFVSLTMEATRELAAECLALDYLFPEGKGERPQPSRALH